jgi:gluconolactonase
MSELRPLDPAHTALVVLDMHASVAGPGTDAGEHAAAQGTVPNIGRLLDFARSNGLLVIHVHHRSATGVRPAGLLPELFRELADDDDLQDGADGMDLVPGLEPVGADLVMHKQRFGAFSGTELDIVLRAAGVTSLVLTGTYTNLSVESTARYGADLGYRIALPSDALCSTSHEWHTGALSGGLSVIAEIGTTDDVLAALSAPANHASSAGSSSALRKSPGPSRASGPCSS